MANWNYISIACPATGIDSTLEKYGKEGWEAWNMTFHGYDAQRARIYFKRIVRISMGSPIPGSEICRWEFKDSKCRYEGSELTCDNTFSMCRERGNIANFAPVGERGRKFADTPIPCKWWNRVKSKRIECDYPPECNGTWQRCKEIGNISKYGGYPNVKG